MSRSVRGDVVVWAYGGTPQYGLVEGVEGERVFVRRLDGTRADRARLLPKPAAHVVTLWDAESFVHLLRDRALLVRSERREPQTHHTD